MSVISWPFQLQYEAPFFPLGTMGKSPNFPMGNFLVWPYKQTPCGDRMETGCSHQPPNKIQIKTFFSVNQCAFMIEEPFRKHARLGEKKKKKQSQDRGCHVADLNLSEPSYWQIHLSGRLVAHMV